MTVSREEIIELWEERAPIEAQQYAIFLAKREDWESWKYIAAIPREDGCGWTEDYMALCKSPINSPFRSPYFALKNDEELELLHTILTNFDVWDFRTSNRIIRKVKT